MSRDQIMRDATAVLQTAAQSAATAPFPQMTVRCLLASQQGGSTPLVFTADATRAGIAALNPNLALASTDQITSAYHNIWWSPSAPQ